jgi:recombination protein RecA
MAKKQTTAVDPKPKKFDLGDAIKKTSRVARTNESRFIPTGSLCLDYVLGGGIPRGHSMTMAGKSFTGKTTLSLLIAKAIQDNRETMTNGGKTLFVSFEQQVPEWRDKIGLHPDSFMFYPPTHGETAMNVVLDAIKTNAVDLIIWDSIAATPMMANLNASMEDNGMAIRARKWTEFLSVVSAIIDSSNVALIGLNHIKQPIGFSLKMFTEPGGECWDYYPSVKLQMLKSERPEERPNAVVMRYQNYFKNRFAPIGRKGETEMYVGDDVAMMNPLPDLVTLGAEFGFIEKSASWYKIDGNALQGEKAAWAYLQSRPALIKELHASISARIAHSAEEKVAQEGIINEPEITLELGDIEDLPGDFYHSGDSFQD